MALGATRSPSLAYDIAKATAKELRAVGINWNFAPVLDVLTDSKEPIVAVRSFSDDPQTVGKFGGAFVQGLRTGGIASCVKHFPGTASLEGEEGRPRVCGAEKTQSDLEDHELIPFRRGVNLGRQIQGVRSGAPDPGRQIQPGAPDPGRQIRGVTNGYPRSYGGLDSPHSTDKSQS